MFQAAGTRLSTLALAALATLVSSVTAPARADKIKMGFTGAPTTLSLPFFVAQKKGWLGDLEVEEVYVTGDSNAMRVLLSKNVDIATIGAVNVLTALEAGANIKAIGSWQPLADYNLVIKTGKGSSLADLAGKTIATSGPGGMPDQLPRMVMRKHKVDENSSRFLQVGGHAARLQAVIGGRADATVINIVTSALGAKDVTVAGKMADEFPKLGYVWNVVREESLSDPRLSKAFETLTVAGIKGSRFIMENPDEAAKIMHERVPELSLDIAKAAVAELNQDKLWGVNGGLDPEIVKFTAELNRELGIVKTAIEPSRLIYSRYVDEALKSLGPAR
jgi:ABC-type nitrate/sulfonate/bicarbonate transport system substrate-binding protein